MHGSTSLKFTGQPDQLKDIGSVNTHGGSFSYNGPIASTNDTNVPSADELVRGAGSWGTVTNASMISLDLNNHDAHIKNKHDLPHSLEVKTNGAIQTDQPIGSKGSMAYTAGTTLSHASLSAEKFIARNAGEDIIATSQKEHIHNGKNYEDVIKQTSVVAGTANTACAGRNIIQTAVEIKSGKEGTHLIAGNEIIDDALAKETHTEKKYEDSGWFEEVAESTKDTHIKPQVCHYKSEGNVIIQAGKKYTGNATIMDAKGEKKIIQAPMVEMVDVKNTHLHESENEERTRGWSATTSPENTMTSQSVGPQFISNGTSPFIIESENTKLVNPQSDAPLVLKGGRAQILLGENKNISIGTSDYSNWLWENEKSHAKMDITYSKLKVPGLENHTKELIIQSVVGETTNFLHKIQKMGDGTVSKNFVEEFHSNDQTSSTRLTTASHIVLGLSFSLLTSGIGTAAGIGAALTSIGVGATTSVILANMTTAALTSLLNNAANHIVESEGDILKAAARMASSDTFKSAALAALSAGAIAGADQALNLVGVPQVQDAVNFSQRLAYAAPRELVHAGIRTGIAVLANQPLREAFTQNITEVAAKTLHTALVGQIADLYGTGQITGPIHKVLHTGAGALYGGIIGGTNGAVAGGLGALTAEVAAEILAPSKQIMETITTFETKTGHSLSQQEFMAHYANALQNYVEKTLSAKQTAQFVATITTLAAGQDVEIAQQSAATALDNNFLVLAAYGITAASTAYSAYNIYKSYENEGAIAGLKQLGIEIAYNAAGHAIGRVGGMVYPSIKAATIAALDEMPAIKMLLGDVAEQLVIAAEKINQTSIGQAVSKVEAKLMEQEAKLLQKLGIKGAAQSKNYGQEQTSTIESAAELTEKEVYAVTPEGIVVKVPKEAPELGVLRESKNVSKQGSKAATQASAQISGEKILPKMKTYDEARNKALELIGKVDSQSGIPHIGRIKACKDKLCGMRWENDKVIIRLDYDPVKGPHLNVDDYRKACSNSFVVPFEGDEKTVKSLLKHLNTKASLEQAKSIYNQTNNEKDLCRITDMIKNFNKKKNKYEK
jgi:hypothetical protein